MKRLLLLILSVLLALTVRAQEMTLDQVISAARTRSVAALEARQAFISTYWAWRSYMASRLPSVYLYGNIMSFDRSLTLLQDPGDGTMKYVSTNNLQNSIGLSAIQNIALTGGVLSVYSDLNRIDQFGLSKSLTWYSQPITISYQQPLFGYNRFKWDRQIEPREYERGRRRYIESMEQITMNAVEAYFNLLMARKNSENTRTNYLNTSRMRDIATERLKLGTVTRDEYLQLELRMLNDSISMNESGIRVREAQMVLNSLLGYDESYEISPVMDEDLPDIVIDYDFAMDKALSNSGFELDNEINLLNARSAIEQAKAQRGITMSFNARFGLSKSGPAFIEAYTSPLDQEVLGFSFSVPVFDWGQGRGRVQKARAAEEVVKAQVMQGENDFRRQLFTAVGQFNTQRSQCRVSRRAAEIAAERYQLIMDKFRTGGASVLELNDARSENDSAITQYITDIKNYWEYYYNLRKSTLYDFLRGVDIDVDINEMVE
ncbi:MAG: TolC family protein [Bacteroidales bacterium]|nr:TolC family protein [Bacteroidales bacterium]